jgi:hypothetical protein
MRSLTYPEDALQVAFVREAMVVSIVNMDSDNEAHELSPARTPVDEASNEEPMDPPSYSHLYMNECCNLSFASR